MKKLNLLMTVILFSVLGTVAQTPKMFNYQAVLRHPDGTIISNEDVDLEISILQGSETGSAVFSETHHLTTTEQGIVNLNIGSTDTTALAAVDWGADQYFVSVSINGELMGTKQLLSVPYALYSEDSRSNDDMITVLEDILTAIGEMSDDIGVMADRIGEMSDRILIMSDNIVETEYMLADISNTLIHQDTLMLAQTEVLVDIADNISHLDSTFSHLDSVMSAGSNCCPACPNITITDDDGGHLPTPNQAPHFTINNPTSSYLVYVSSNVIMSENTSIPILVHDYTELNDQWANLNLLDALGLSSGNNVYIAVKTVDGNVISNQSNILSYQVN